MLLCKHLILIAEVSELGAHLFDVLFLCLDLVLDDWVQVLHVSGWHAAGRGHRTIFLRLLDLLKHLLALLKLFLNLAQLVGATCFFEGFGELSDANLKAVFTSDLVDKLVVGLHDSDTATHMLILLALKLVVECID